MASMMPLLPDEKSNEQKRSMRQDLALTGNNTVQVIAGGNFSGRSRLLQQAVSSASPGSIAQPEFKATYVPPELALSVSGLRPTVREELLLHHHDQEFGPHILDLLELTGLDRLLNHNPTTLSGGELALMVMACKTILQRRLIAFDCALEQIAPAIKQTALNFITTHPSFGTPLFLADNRLSELERLDFRLLNPANYLLPPIRNPLPLSPVIADLTPIAPSSTPSIELCNISFSYQPGQKILKNIDLRLDPGTIYLLHGRNGAGKSTLAKLLCGILRPNRGTIKLNGKPFVPYLNPGSIFGYLYQDPDVQFVEDTVLADVEAGVKGIHMQARSERVEMALSLFGLKEMKHQEIAELPYVLRKRVSLAGLLAAAKPWLVIDEPTLGQDDTTLETLIKVFTDLSSAGHGIIIITHSLFLKKRLLARELYLEDGAISQIIS